MQRAIEFWKEGLPEVSVDELISKQSSVNLGAEQRSQGWLCPYCFDPVFFRPGHTRYLSKSGKTIQVKGSFCHYKQIDNKQDGEICIGRSLGKVGDKNQSVVTASSPRGQSKFEFSQMMSKKFILQEISYHCFSFESSITRHQNKSRLSSIYNMFWEKAGKLIKNRTRPEEIKPFSVEKDNGANIVSEASFLTSWFMSMNEIKHEEFSDAFFSFSRELVKEMLVFRLTTLNYIKSRNPKGFREQKVERESVIKKTYKDRVYRDDIPAFIDCVTNKSDDAFTDYLMQKIVAEENSDDQTVLGYLVELASTLLGVSHVFMEPESYKLSDELFEFLEKLDVPACMMVPGLKLGNSLIHVPGTEIAKRIDRYFSFCRYLLNPNNIQSLAQYFLAWRLSTDITLMSVLGNIDSDIKKQEVMDKVVSLYETRYQYSTPETVICTDFQAWLLSCFLTIDWKTVDRYAKANHYAPKKKPKGFKQCA